MSLMLAEIAEQPAALERTIAAERAKIAQLGNVLKSRDIDLIVLVARGSSDNAALFGRYLLEITTGIPVSLSAPSVHDLQRRAAAGPRARRRRFAVGRRRRHQSRSRKRATLRRLHRRHHKRTRLL